MEMIKVRIIKILLVCCLTAVISICPALADMDFQKWMQDQSESFSQYKDERDQEFIGFFLLCKP